MARLDSLAEVHADLGIAWASVGKGAGLDRPLHIAVCYFPPESSSYYRKQHSHGSIPLETHLEALGSSICKYKAKGDVMLVGDFNARTGSEADVMNGVDDWASMSSSGVAVPEEIMLHAMLQAIPEEESGHTCTKCTWQKAA